MKLLCCIFLSVFVLDEFDTYEFDKGEMADESGNEVTGNISIEGNGTTKTTHTYTLKILWDDTNEELGVEYNDLKYINQTFECLVNLKAVPTGDNSEKYSTYTINKQFNVNILTAPFYFDAKANITEYEYKQGSLNINVIISNNNGTKYNLFNTNYELSITGNNKFAITAEIESLEATFGKFTDLSAEHLEAATAEIGQLKVYSGDFTYLMAEEFKAINAVIKDLNVDNLDAKYANIDFANINEAAIRKIFSDSGLIKDLVVGDSTITGELVGVTIKGDLIEGNTVKADKLVVKGSDGIYYKLNIEGGTFTGGEEVPTDSLHGSVITAKSITAEKVSVKDLVAFGATIGGFNITSNSIYSGVKESVTNSTRGVYMDRDGQFAVGDSANYLKYYRDTDGVYKLAIAAGSIILGASGKTVEEALDDAANLEIGGRNLIRNSKVLVFDTYGFEDAYLDFTYDIDGNVMIKSNIVAVEHDASGNVNLISPYLGVDHDEETDNVTLYSTLEEEDN